MARYFRPAIYSTFFLLSWAVGLLSSFPAFARDRDAPPPLKPLRWLMTSEEMRKAGLALRIIPRRDERVGDFGAPGGSYSNKCFFEPNYELSLSNKKLAYFQARGFSLEALCLAMTSPVHYDPETGRPVPVAIPAVVDDTNRARKAVYPAAKLFMFVLSPPDCFKNGTPRFDCRIAYDPIEGVNFTAAEQQENHLRAVKADQWIRRVIGGPGYDRECTCNQIGISDAVDDRGALRIRETCRVDTFPACARSWVTAQDPVGTLVIDIQNGYTLEKRYKPAELLLGTAYGGFEISPKLPHGYAYRIGTPEGDDDLPDELPPPMIRTGGDE